MTDEVVMAVMAAFRDVPGRPRGESWDLCRRHRAYIQQQLENRVRRATGRVFVEKIGITFQGEDELVFKLVATLGGTEIERGEANFHRADSMARKQAK